jgi:translation initiation factor eIF-2B subunit delta
MVGIKKPVATTAATIAIRRVVTCFIVANPSNRMAVFHRCEIMPSFPSHWAGISGAIESIGTTTSTSNDDASNNSKTERLYETPLEAATRELLEETNLLTEVKNVVVEEEGGLYLDVPYLSRSRTGTPREGIVRVYPFSVRISDDDVPRFEMRGTEHDTYKFVALNDLIEMESKCVPGLIQAFHHATYGRFDSTISESVRNWADDRENGASVMTQNAIQLVHDECNVCGISSGSSKENSRSEARVTTARHIALLRPSMVPIVNVMNRIIADKGRGSVTMKSFLNDLDKCVTMTQAAIQDLMAEQTRDTGSNHPFDDKTSSSLFTIATFSRSGTLSRILKPFAEEQSCRIVCSQSTPGDEGELMAKDLDTNWIPDRDMHELLSSNSKKGVDLLLIGSDCIVSRSTMVNKVGTKKLCETAQRNGVPVFCCADAWKVWDDIFPPPIETDLFEFVPLDLVTKVLVPSIDTN